MSDEQTSAPRQTPAGLYEHGCEHPGCKKDGGWGFALGKTAEPHWFCYQHKADGEQYIR
ncbi:hypothetical protein [Aminobacter sp. DSM 101952]|uniref:hypothetical protein n=1 Tax=Aminobacter sp. DSM 101952 TaxID=2735891 RepID=UPI00160C5F94|nr:hypothetical protein [Aminobacter sp. DSM 101952]